MSAIKKLLVCVSLWGVKEVNFTDEIREKRITNCLTLLSILAHTVILSLFLIAGIKTHIPVICTFLFSFFFLFPITCKLSVKYSKYHLVIATAMLPITMALYAPVEGGLFLGFSYAQIYILVMILMLFDFNKEEIEFFFLITCSLIYTLLYDEILLVINDEIPDILFLYEQYIFFKVPLLAVWALILILFIWRQSDINKSVKRIGHLNKQLIKEKALVENMNQELKREIANRVQRLNQHKVKIEEYAYRSAHDVKGPLARIQGLCHLLNMDQLSEAEVKEMLRMLDRASIDLYNSLSNLDQEMADQVNHLFGINGSLHKRYEMIAEK